MDIYRLSISVNYRRELFIIEWGGGVDQLCKGKQAGL